MADIVNLRQFKKQKERSQKADRADQNRAKSGQTKATKLKQKSDLKSLNKTLDGAKRDKPPTD